MAHSRNGTAFGRQIGNTAASTLKRVFACLAVLVGLLGMVETSDASSDANKKMQNAYEDALKKLSHPGVAQLQTSQRAWQKYVDKYCLSEPHSKLHYYANSEECIQREEYTRFYILLGVTRRLGPFQVLRLDIFRLGGQATYSNYCTDWVDIESSSKNIGDKAKLWNEFHLIEAFKVGRQDRFVIQEKAFANAEGNPANQEKCREIDFATNVAIGYTDSFSEYGHGAAHGWSTESRGLLYLPTGKQLGSGDLLQNNTSWVKLVVAQANAAFGPSGDFDDIISDPKNWELSEEGVTFHFGLMDGYAGGEKTLLVPWNQLTPFLTPIGVEIVNSLAEPN